jgi:hypothetical protein
MIILVEKQVFEYPALPFPVESFLSYKFILISIWCTLVGKLGKWFVVYCYASLWFITTYLLLIVFWTIQLIYILVKKNLNILRSRDLKLAVQRNWVESWRRSMETFLFTKNCLM